MRSLPSFLFTLFPLKVFLPKKPPQVRVQSDTPGWRYLGCLGGQPVDKNRVIISSPRRLATHY